MTLVGPADEVKKYLVEHPEEVVRERSLRSTKMVLWARQGMVFESSKTYPHSLGLSVTFRQWPATESHCRFVHGYALQVKLDWRSQQLDHRNWVMDFGGLKDVKGHLQALFDHKLVIAKDDPEIEYFRLGHQKKVLELLELDIVGCEGFAYYIFNWTEQWFLSTHHQRVALGVMLQGVTVSEHEGNSATYRRET